jgi:hypothetical protein
VRVYEAQFVPDDDKRTLGVLAIPIWECPAIDLKREALVRFVDDVSAEVSEGRRRTSDICPLYPTETGHLGGRRVCQQRWPRSTSNKPMSQDAIKPLVFWRPESL